VTLPWVTVERGSGPVRPLPPATETVPAVVVPRVDGTPAPLAHVLQETHTDAFLAMHEGRLAVEHYRGAGAESDLHPLMSVTKSLVGCVAGALVARRALDPAMPVPAYVPELEASGYGSASVRDLLDMRTSVEYAEDEGPELPSLERMGQVGGWLPRTLPDLPGSLRSFLVGLGSATGTGAGGPGGFVYRSTDTEALSWVVERAAREPLPALVGTLLLEPVGAETAGAFSVDPSGVAIASGGLSLRPRDLARIGQMLMDGGAVGTEQVLPASFIRDTRTGGTDSREAFRSYVVSRLGGSAPARVRALYRNQFWVLTRGRRLLALGVHGQMMLVDWENASVVVKLSGWPDPRDPVAFMNSLAAVDATARALGGDAGSVPGAGLVRGDGPG